MDAHAERLAEPEAARGAVGEHDVECAVLQALQRAEDGELGGPRNQSGRRDARSMPALQDAHLGADPTPGTNGGLR